MKSSLNVILQEFTRFIINNGGRTAQNILVRAGKVLINGFTFCTSFCMKPLSNEGGMEFS